MCTIVDFLDSNQTASTVGELAEILGGIDKLHGYTLETQYCLCGVSIPVTAAMNGFLWKHNSFGYDLKKCKNKLAAECLMGLAERLLHHSQYKNYPHLHPAEPNQ